ncbi:Spy0128 family protein [Enterococcus cecorum]|uniref:Spy0128 family protein n=1 Tax=Enterococcus cecorum TaxID=44008 RepID=UPI00148CA782|nr:FctA domain-containing protein [Enterococcus cecorum]
MKRRKVNKLFGVASLLALFGVGALLFTNSVEAKNEDAGEEDQPTLTAAELTLKKNMLDVAGYKPEANDKFTVTFKQLTDDEADKYWPEIKATPSPEIELDSKKIDGTKAQEDISANKKTVEVKYNLSSLDEEGYYVYEVKESAPSDAWTSDGKTYILKVRVYYKDEDEETNELVQEAQLIEKDDTAPSGVKGEKSTVAEFTNTLKPQTKEVSISKYVVGYDQPLVESGRKYTIHVVASKADDSHSADEFDVKIGAETVKGNYSEGGFDIQLEDGGKATMNLPLGTKLAVNEKAPGKRFEVKIDPNSKVAADEDDEGYEVLTSDTPDSSVVTDVVTNDSNDSNSIVVTNKIKSLVNTGVKLVTSPFVVLLAVVAVAFGGYVVVKRRLNVK